MAPARPCCSSCCVATCGRRPRDAKPVAITCAMAKCSRSRCLRLNASPTSVPSGRIGTCATNRSSTSRRSCSRATTIPTFRCNPQPPRNSDASGRCCSRWGWPVMRREHSCRCRTASAAACCWRAPFVREPDVLLLDEALNGLDVKGRAAFLRALRLASSPRTAWILTSHRRGDAPAGLTHVARIAHGGIESVTDLRVGVVDPSALQIEARPKFAPASQRIAQGASVGDSRIRSCEATAAIASGRGVPGGAVRHRHV